MKEQVKPVDLHKGANLIYNEVKRKLEDTKTVVFIIMVAINIFLWGLDLAADRNTSDLIVRQTEQYNKEISALEDRVEVLQIYINNLKVDTNE